MCYERRDPNIARECWDRDQGGKRMAERLVRIGGTYRHFKGKRYQVLTTARHAETGEIMVIYAAMYGTHTIWARPYREFMSEVNRDAYPDAQQKYRFELVEE